MSVSKWLPVVGYEDIYEVSDKGQVRSIDRFVNCFNGRRLIKGRDLTLVEYNNHYVVGLRKPGCKKKVIFVHRLVAEAFIPNPQNFNVVNHIDENGFNNDVHNLEWCTNEYNLSYGNAKEKRKKTIRERLCNGHYLPTKTSRPVAQCDLNGKVLKRYRSCNQAAIILGLSESNILSTAKGKHSHCGGYLWRFI